VRFPRPAPAGALLAVVVVVPTAVVMPTFTASVPAPHPVAADVQSLPIDGVDRQALRQAPVPDELESTWRKITTRTAAARSATRPPVAITGQIATDGFRMLGVTWKGAAPSEDGAVVVTARTRTDDRWTDWFEVPTSVDAGTQASPNGRFGTVPYWAGDSDAVQVRVDAVGSARPTDVRADLIEPGTSDADATVTGGWSGSTASAATERPPIVTRAEWGADESLRDKRLENSDTFKVAFVHHTAGSNNYTPSESPAVVRGLYSYYVNTLKYADMGYNFLVDKYGTIYEGRAGSITKPVRSAASGGFNTNTLAVVAMGNFESAPASDALVRGISKVLAYRLSRYHRDPFGRKQLTAEVGSSKYSAGTKVSFKVISGHRDSQLTACPGGNLYRELPAIRRLANGYMGSSLIEPTLSRTSVPMGSDVSITARARVTQSQSWALTVRKFCSGELVRRLTGNASPGDPITARWRGRTENGKLAPPGRYRVTLTSSGNGSSAWPYARSVVVGVGGDAAAPTTSSLNGTSAGSYVPQRPQTLLSTTSGKGTKNRLILGPDRRLDVQVLGRAGVPASGVTAVALSVEAECASTGTRVTVGPDTVSGAGARAVSVNRDGTARAFIVVRVGPGGGIRFQNAAGAVGLKASVVGYVSTNGGGGSLHPLPRTSLGGASPLPVDPSPVSVDVAGRAGVPAGAKAAVLAIRRTAGSPVGAVWAWPAGAEKPGAPTWSRPRGSASVSQVVVPVGDNGQIRVAANKSGSVAFDVAGYVASDGARSVHPVVPKSLLGSGKQLGKGEAERVGVRGRAGIPPEARAVVVQVTGSAGKKQGRLTLWPRGAAEPTSADLVVPARAGRETLSVLRIGKGGDVRLRARDAALRANLTVVGWIR
jgi:hypothetical protein